MPGKQNFLTGNMGELRPGHFHAGLDIKTAFKEGLPVYAAASGYISRINISERGYGIVLYMKHPNGTTTVYAHNRNFPPRIDSLVRFAQYANKTYEIDLNFRPNELIYNKGDIIAYSGNSGASGGPHLHFEIRDSLNRYLNPLEAGFSEIKDSKPPFISKVILKPMHKLSRINDEFSNLELSTKKINENLYVVKDTIYVSENYPIGLEINSYDFMDGIYNLQGINYISLSLDGKDIFDYSLTKFNLEQSHCIDAHVDYEVLRKKGSWFHKCYLSDGNILDAYKTKNKGYVYISDTLKTHKLVATVKDYHGNSSQIVIHLNAKKHDILYKKGNLKNIFGIKPKMTEQLFENILKLEYSDKQENMKLLAELHCKNGKFAITPSYLKGNHTTVYLIDLKKYLPDSISICEFVYKLNFRKMIVPHKQISYSEDNITLDFHEMTLFDTLYLRITKKGTNFSINDYTIPFFEDLDVKINSVNDLEDKEHTSVYFDAGRGYYGYAGGWWSDAKKTLNAKIKGPGVLKTGVDKSLPFIKILKSNKKELSFRASDTGSGIAKYECYLNGEWVLLNYDYKRQFFWAVNKSKFEPFAGEYVIKVTDKVGNESIKKGKIKKR